jgi:cytochrome c oxidase subunit 2
MKAAAALLLASITGDTRGATANANVQAGVIEPLVIDIIGVEYEWRLLYPGPDGRLNTGDDRTDMRHLHLPAHTDVRLQLHSEDYVYSFSLPHRDLKEIAVPDLEFALSFTTGKEGIFELLGDQMCGYAHPKLMGKLIIISADDFATRMRNLSHLPGG